MKTRKVVLYISMSLDGYIAAEDDGLAWLKVVAKEGEDYGYNNFTQTVDTYIVGRKTYEVVLGLCGGKLPQADSFNCYVITHKRRKAEKGVTFYNGDLKGLIDKLKGEPGKNIYCDGGGQLVNALMQEDLIDEYVISVIPVILGSGKRLFAGNTPPLSLIAEPSKYYSTGLVQLKYRRR